MACGVPSGTPKTTYDGRVKRISLCPSQHTMGERDRYPYVRPSIRWESGTDILISVPAYDGRAGQISLCLSQHTMGERDGYPYVRPSIRWESETDILMSFPD
ncbi:hypothetical protein M0802_014061 [Mischocyttarus mexicanus]|nr:hypothetical protein M0802_014061 [Mischocyttarus mexicanus]